MTSLITTLAPIADLTIPTGRDMASPTTVKAKLPSPERMLSVDAMRGFDMFWLIGGDRIVTALIAWIHWDTLTTAANREMDHPVWSGFHWWDVIMPTFIFISGVTIPLTVTRRLESGELKSRIFWRLIRRAFALQLLDLTMYGALEHPTHWREIRFGGVLAHIGWTYLFAGLIVMHTRNPRRQFIWLAGILLGYWAAMALIPVPGGGTGLMTPDGNLAGYIDRNLMPGVLFGEVYEREGFFAIIPTIATVLMGALAGRWLLSERRNSAKVLGLIAVGIACRLVAQVWSVSFPINTKMWTSSLVLAAGGWSLIFLGLFYQVVDVWKLRRWAFFFTVIGMNSILIYVLQNFVDFDHVAEAVYNGFISLASEVSRPLLMALAVLVGVKWLMLLFLYRKRIFVRV